MVKDDVFTSIHIEEYETEARDTKLGPEEITRDIPNVGDDALKDLDERGIIRVGAEVHAGGHPGGQGHPQGGRRPHRRGALLRAIFGVKAREVRDTSLKVPHGESGIIVDVKASPGKPGTSWAPASTWWSGCTSPRSGRSPWATRWPAATATRAWSPGSCPRRILPFLPDGTPLDIVPEPLGVPSRMNIGQVLEVHLGRAAQALGWKVATPVIDIRIEKDIMELLAQAGLFREVYPNETIAGKQLYLVTEDGTDVRRLDQEEMADTQQIRVWRKEGRLRLADGKTRLYDGRTGEMFENPVTVGYVYFLKLHHLVDDKIHARSTGPYSLVTQQPLGGKAQFGGQRFGEMEVWALEAYGAAYTLQEILTVKSDDVTGRVKTYEAIVKGHNVPKPGIPESFKVLVKELQALCLDIKVLDAQGEEIELRDDEEEGYQSINQIRDDDYRPYQQEDADAQFSAAGYTIKESSDDDDLSVGDAMGDSADDDYGDGSYDE